MASAKLSAITNISAPAVTDLVYGEAGGVEKSYPLDRLLGFGLWGRAGGRLTLETGVPVSTTDQTAKTTIYWTPAESNLVAVYDATRVKLYTFSELSVALGTLSNATLYDIFLWDTSGLALKIGPAWSNSGAGTSARGTGAGTTELERFNGVLVNKVSIASGPAARAGLYLGTFLTTATTDTEDSEANRLVWNAYNQVERRGRRNDDANPHTMNATGPREWNAGTTARIQFVIGEVRRTITQSVSLNAEANAVSTNSLVFANLNGTTGVRDQFARVTGGDEFQQLNAVDVWLPVLGLNYLTVSEQQATANNCTFDLCRNRAAIWA